jgi:hypothetical protein
MEIWKDIKNYEGSYQVSNTGKIRSLPKTWVSGKGCIKHHSGKVLSINNGPNGYKVVQLTRPVRELVRVSIIVAKTFVSNPDNLPEVNHIDGDKSNNNDWNLEWTDRIGNMIHASKLNLLKPVTGENHHFSKITNLEVLEIKELHSTQTFKLKDLAVKFNTSISTIHNVIKNKTRNKWLVA